MIPVAIFRFVSYNSVGAKQTKARKHIANEDTLDTQDNTTELTDEQLETVNGGTLFSSGVEDPKDHIFRQYVIVTIGNYCALGAGEYCKRCKHCFKVGITRYCDLRWCDHSNVVTITNPDGSKDSFIVDD